MERGRAFVRSIRGSLGGIAIERYFLAGGEMILWISGLGYDERCW